LLASAVTAWWSGPVKGQYATSGPRESAGACVVTPEQTEGPYFVEEHLHRSDIRFDPGDGSVRPGLPLKLQIHVQVIDRVGCRPLAGAVVDIWHCDAQGMYSDVSERRFQSVGSRFLRGDQVTDASGAVRFATIYPGWYPGRAVHIHLEIRTQPDAANRLQWTSQLYFDDAITGMWPTRSGIIPEREMSRTAFMKFAAAI
jgi:protocatechuate 3,4-dioxygenase beta subunit